MRPSVSIVLPTLNERTYIRDCLDSLRSQDYPAIREVLVCDGGSTDGTREIVKAEGGVVRLVDNVGVTAAAGMNVGLAAASGEVIVRADAHTIYSPSYVSRSVATLDRLQAAVVGGPMRAVGESSFGRAVSAVTSSPLGIGPGRFHFGREEVQVETVYLGVFRRQTVLDAGGYDQDQLQWGAEDQELNFRIRRRGGAIWLDPEIVSWYFPRDTPRALWRQYLNYGVCKASTLAKHRTLPYWRPLVPAVLVAGSTAVAVGATIAGRPAIGTAPVLLYVAGAGVAAVHLSKEPGVSARRSFAAIAICHWSYGVGFWRGIGWALRGRPFQNRPVGHR
jgi:glycosyltransferase involved in cell wall biosynthesis